MKILQVQYSGIGGVAAVANSLSSADYNQDHQWFSAYYGVTPIACEHIEFCVSNKITYKQFTPCHAQPLLAWINLYKWINQCSPDAILCHSVTAIMPCIIYSKLHKIPLIAIEHTPNQVKTRNEWVGTTFAVLFADRTVVLTSIYAQQLSQKLSFLYRDHHIVIIPNGINTRLYTPSHETRIPIRHSVIKAGMAGRFVSSKRFDILIKAVSQVGIKLELAGDGQTLEACKQLAHQYSGDITFMGMLSSSELINWMNDLDVYLHASDGETFSMAILQAMALEKPILASNISGMTEILGSKADAGLLVNNTVEDWADTINHIGNRPDLRHELGQKARQRAVTLYDHKRILSYYIKTIDDCC